jgi:hypothetical protein
MKTSEKLLLINRLAVFIFSERPRHIDAVYINNYNPASCDTAELLIQ